MGVYIRGMEMPKSCAECPLIYFYDERAWCHGGALCTHDWDEKLNEGRTEKCPLIEIQPHGRLIDADAFIKEECNSCDGACESIPCDCLNCAADCRCDFMKDIADAPTIIPAEEGE